MLRVSVAIFFSIAPLIYRVNHKVNCQLTTDWRSSCSPQTPPLFKALKATHFYEIYPRMLAQTLKKYASHMATSAG